MAHQINFSKVMCLNKRRSCMHSSLVTTHPSLLANWNINIPFSTHRLWVNVIIQTKKNIIRLSHHGWLCIKGSVECVFYLSHWIMLRACITVLCQRKYYQKKQCRVNIWSVSMNHISFLLIWGQHHYHEPIRIFWYSCSI